MPPGLLLPPGLLPLYWLILLDTDLSPGSKPLLCALVSWVTPSRSLLCLLYGSTLCLYSKMSLKGQTWTHKPLVHSFFNYQLNIYYLWPQTPPWWVSVCGSFGTNYSYFTLCFWWGVRNADLPVPLGSLVSLEIPETLARPGRKNK